jgi:phenylalanyl-tRNA synthetase beta chain
LNVSYKWLKELVGFDLTPEELAEKITFIGLEVERLSQVGQDWCFELELTSNRPDCLSIIGVAREVSVVCGKQLLFPDYTVETSGEETAALTSVEILDTDLCPRYSAQVIRDVELKESPDWLKEKLEVIGVRPVNNVVDVTNFVTMEFGQPLHAFDYDKLAENRIVVRRAKAGESITAINGKNYSISENMLAICDALEPVAIAGVMGGLFSEVTERTKNVLLESAYFDPLSVRKTSRQLVLESAASYRFERGVDPELVLSASLRAAKLITEIAGGRLAPEPVDINHQTIEFGSATVRFSRIPKLTGYEVAPSRAIEILKSLGLEPTAQDKESVTVSIPPRRSDISREIDLIEEVLRHEGIEKVPFIDIATSDVRPEPGQKFLLNIREHMQGFGFFELLSDSFVTDNEEGKLCFFEAGEPLRVRNPVKAEKPVLRRSLLPNMLAACRSGLASGEWRPGMAGLFEASVVYLPGPEKLPEEKHVLSFLSPQGYPGVKGTLEALLSSLREENAAFESFNHAAFTPGKTSCALLDGTRFAFLGDLCEELKRQFDIEGTWAGCEADLDFLYSHLKEDIIFKPIPRFPKVLRDMAVVIDDNVLWQELHSEIQGMGISLLKHIELFDVYRGKQLPVGKKSIACSLEFQSAERTLTGEEVDREVGKIAKHLAKTHGAQLRK